MFSNRLVETCREPPYGITLVREANNWIELDYKMICPRFRSWELASDYWEKTDIAREKGRRKGTSKNDQIIGRMYGYCKKASERCPIIVNDQDKI